MKKITNFKNTKKVLDNIKLELPEVPNINDIKLIKLNREKVENEIIKPKDDLIIELHQENILLHKIIDKFYETVEKFIDWICHKFGIRESKELVKNFQEETHIFIDPVKQLDFEEKQKELEWDLER